MTASATLYLKGMLKVLAALACVAMPLVGTARADDTGGDGDIDDIDLLSSVMWQPLASGQNYIYPPGIPGVLRAEQTGRTFHVEQYYSMAVDATTLMPHVLGTWANDQAHALVWSVADQTWSNQYATIKVPVCDQDGGDYGYRCVTDLTFAPDTPTGTIGLSIGMVVNGIEFTHPNSIFWVILPDASVTIPSVVKAAAQPKKQTPPTVTYDLTDDAKQVVRISLTGNFSLGSGFLTRTIAPLAKLFKPSVMQAAALIPDPQIFVVTAGHLFPVGYTYGSMQDPLADGVIEDDGAPMQLGYVYDLNVNGKLLPNAALLFARNAESDIALMQIRKESLAALAAAIGVDSADDILGLTFATTVDTDPAHDQSHVIMGYPAARTDGSMVQRVGDLALNEYPTDDTSNFGPLGKLKLTAVDPKGPDIAEPGMSGGPVLDSSGDVVGLTIERPNDTNSLIALDLTSISALTSGFALDEKTCMLRFSPFDRILTLVRRDPACDYGHFGSPAEFPLLNGSWTIQEILGFADSTDDSSNAPPDPTNGHTIINGHAIINGHVIINGVVTIRSAVLIVNSDNLDDINNSELRGGFKLNKDSFRSFMPKGVRILDYTGVGAPGQVPLGDLILGTRVSATATSYAPVYSIRDFVIWLHSNIAQPDYASLLCITGECQL